MKPTEFWKILSEANKKDVVWSVYKTGRIRCQAGGDTYCPITLVAFLRTGEYFAYCDWEYAAKEMALDRTWAKKVALASDNIIDLGNFKYYRNRIKKCVGLS